MQRFVWVAREKAPDVAVRVWVAREKTPDVAVCVLVAAADVA